MTFRMLNRFFVICHLLICHWNAVPYVPFRRWYIGSKVKKGSVTRYCSPDWVCGQPGAATRRASTISSRFVVYSLEKSSSFTPFLGSIAGGVDDRRGRRPRA